MVSSTPRPHFTPGKEPVPILQEAGWSPGFPTSSSELFKNSVPVHDMKAYGGGGVQACTKHFSLGGGELTLRLYVFVIYF